MTQYQLNPLIPAHLAKRIMASPQWAELLAAEEACNQTTEALDQAIVKSHCVHSERRAVLLAAGLLPTEQPGPTEQRLRDEAIAAVAARQQAYIATLAAQAEVFLGDPGAEENLRAARTALRSAEEVSHQAYHAVNIHLSHNPPAPALPDGATNPLDTDPAIVAVRAAVLAAHRANSQAQKRVDRAIEGLRLLLR